MPINLRQWGSKTISDIKDDPIKGAVKASYNSYLGLWLTLTSRLQVGDPIFDSDWDICLVLDACRTDALQEVADEYEFLPSEIHSIWSVGSTSEEWLANTFVNEYRDAIRDTALITSNPYTERLFVRNEDPPTDQVCPFGWPSWDIVNEEGFAELDQVWKYGVDDQVGQTPPRPITDHVIAAAQSGTPRVIGHYMQPHEPYIANAIEANRGLTDIEANPWSGLRSGEYTRADVWAIYLDNLRLVLDEVEIVLNNVNAEEVVITADHGELFGRYFQRHPTGLPHPSLRRVPWVKTVAENQETHEPEVHSETDRIELETHLEALGYRQ